MRCRMRPLGILVGAEQVLRGCRAPTSPVPGREFRLRNPMTGRKL